MLEIDIGTVIFSIVTFALLALLLRLFLYKPVLAMLDKRRQAVNEALDQAERTRVEAEKADERLQEKLNAAGYNCGTPDGAAGKKTKAAITSYQTDKGLTVTLPPVSVAHLAIRLHE